MSEDLQPLTPSEARDLHLEAMKENAAEWTRVSHRSHLRAFVEWCRTEGGIDNMNDLTGRDLYQFRVWRREGGYSKGKTDTLAPKTLDSALTTVRSFLRFCEQIEAVPEGLREKVILPTLSASSEVSDSTIAPERVPPVIDYLDRYEYASRDHVVWALVWHTGARLGAVRALDLEDCELDNKKPGINYIHRPDSDTPLKNDERGERFNRISDRVATVLQDYIDGPRISARDDYGRFPLVSTKNGRISPTAIRDTFYRWTRPCFTGDECPHGEEPETCEAARFDQMSKCPSARSPHDVRKARVTKYRNDGVPRGVVSDRLDTSEAVLDKHYDRASKREKADRRWRMIRE
ncbi:tyrosine-type recombinase/integrase [Halobaculum gomorrense]|uniref:Phage integrase family protein n=1 Tax=Halobaculum gomorrense TaxID=43928 RepID=A0A1M5RBC8_9EURY|nr:site-specific integrase [Halobaculum gomorrense]SHH23657.1 Phage integrase family protein [Halobaculum gomorrense]